MRISLLCISLAAAAAAAPVDTGASPRVRKVLIIGIDGVRPDALLRARTPHLDSLIDRGAFADRARTDFRTRSGPGWTSVLTGVWSPRHGARNNLFEGRDARAYPTWFARLREARPGLVAGAVVNWAPIGTRLVGADGFWMAPGNDRRVAEEAAALIRAGLPDVLLVHFDDPDHAGHRFGFSPRMPLYLWALERVDRNVGLLRAALADREALGEDWLVISTSDHGGSFRHHGEDIPEHRTVFLLASGSGIARGRTAETRGVVDVAPTLFAWLGLPVPAAWGWEGRPFGLSAAPPATLLAAPEAPGAANVLAGVPTERQQP